MRPIPALFIAMLASPALAEQTRELDSHEHGVGALDIAIDGTKIAMEFHAPGADIVGFEYRAESAQDRAAIDDAIATLSRPLDLFILPAAAACTVVQASAALESEDEHEDHDEHEHADDHAHEDDQDHDEEHAHGDEQSGAETHTEFHAEYQLTCGNPDALSEISFAYFDTFETARELEIRIVSASGAQAAEVERDNPVLDLRGMF